MDDLVAFLNARLDEDEQQARAAISGQVDWENGWGESKTPGFPGVGIVPHVGRIHEDVQAAHVAKWNPARVLADVEAKRRILAEHAVDAGLFCRTCFDPGTLDRYPDEFSQRRFPCPTLRLLALPFASHPDYRDEWKP